jgi:hypothetical protein
LNSNQEKFSITWEDLKYLLEHAEISVRESASYITTSKEKNQLLMRIQKLKEKYDYNARAQKDAEELQKKQEEERERKRQEEFKPIKEKLIELSKKYSRLLIKEIEEELNLKNQGTLIREAIKDMIEKEEFKAKFFSSSDSIVFQIDQNNH